MTNSKEHGLGAILLVYWRAYGGWRAVLKSPFFWLSLILLALTARFWLFDSWWNQVLSVVPNLLGFTLGGFAVFLGFGDEKFKRLIAGNDNLEGETNPDETSIYMEVCAAFLHFVLIQVASLIAAIIGNATCFEIKGSFSFISVILAPIQWIGSMLGYWLFLYGICLAGAAAIAIFRVSYWFNYYQSIYRGDDQ